MAKLNAYKKEMYTLRSMMLVGAVKDDRDVRIATAAQGYKEALDFSLKTRHTLLIDDKAWAYVESRGYPPHFVFCHPNILMSLPSTSLYYRGMTGLSLKAVQQLAHSVNIWESKPDFRLRGQERAENVARLYNLLLSSIIVGTQNWILENGYRTILATMGISFDGLMRNKSGEIAEERIRAVLCNFIVREKLLETRGSIPEAGPVRLKNNITMHFSDDPDVYFTNAKDEAIATIEIKGGTDEAGGLERLGATQKSFLKAIQAIARCKTYFVSGVITPRYGGPITEGP